MAARSRHNPVPYLLSRTPRGTVASAPQLPAQLGEGSCPPSLPKPPLRCPSVPRHGSGASGRLRPIRSCAGRMDSDPTGVQSPGAQPSHAQIPYGAGQGRHAARHGAGGTGPHPSPCRIPPPRGGEPFSAGRLPNFAAAEPRGCDGAWGLRPRDPSVYPQQLGEETEQPCHLLRTLKPGAGWTSSPRSERGGAACWSPAPLARISRPPS